MIWVGMTTGDQVGEDNGVPVSIYPEEHARSRLIAGTVTSRLQRYRHLRYPSWRSFRTKVEKEEEEEVTHWTHEFLVLGLFIALIGRVILQTTMSWEGDGAGENLEKALRAAPKDLTTVVMFGHLLRPEGPRSSDDCYKIVNMFD